jgi:hypothetical protein
MVDEVLAAAEDADVPAAADDEGFEAEEPEEQAVRARAAAATAEPTFR